MLNSIKSKKVRSSRIAGLAGKRKSPSGYNSVLRAIVFSFVCGVAISGLLLCLFAALLAHTSLPLAFVRPMACAAAAVGVAVSGLLLARQMKKGLLLCGLSCGLFYAVCQLTAAWLVQGTFPQGSDLVLTFALLLSGVFGGALAAVWSTN